MSKLILQWNELNMKKAQMECANDGIERWPMWPKIVQVNGSDIYIVAGNNTTPKTQNSQYQKSKSKTYKIDLRTWRLVKKADV